MSTLTISTFTPQISWPHGGSTATLRIQYSADFQDSDGQQVLRGMPQNVTCSVAGTMLTVPQFNLITTNDADVNALVTCSARFYDANNTPRDWLFQSFVIPQLLAPSATIGALRTYNQGSSLVLPPEFYLDRDETLALINNVLAGLGLAAATDLALGIVKLSAASLTPAAPVVWEQGDPNARDAQKWKGKSLSSLMAAPANTNVPVFNSATDSWEPGVGMQGAAGGDLSGTYPNPSVVDDSHLHSVATLVGLGALAILSTVGTAQIDNDAVTFAKMQNVAANSVPARAAGTSGDLSEVALAASQLLGRGASGDVAAIVLGTNLSMSGTTLNASGGGSSTTFAGIEKFANN